jgi:hypothetical protein
MPQPRQVTISAAAASLAGAPGGAICSLSGLSSESPIPSEASCRRRIALIDSSRLAWIATGIRVGAASDVATEAIRLPR